MHPDEAPDPYRHLEDGSEPRTVAWTAEQNARTRAHLDALPGREPLERVLSALLELDVVGVPVVRGGRAFFTARRGAADQASLRVREGGAERALLDPAALDPSGLTALDWWYPSPAGTHVVLGLSTRGDERSTLRVLDVATGGFLTEAIPDTRYASVAWLPGGEGFYYTRYPAGEQYNPRVRYHALGTDGAADPVLFGDGRKPSEMLSLAISPDGRRLAVTVQDGWARSDVYLADLAGLAPGGAPRFARVVEGVAALHDVEPTDAALLVRTNDGAPRFRLFAADYRRLERGAWRELVPEGEGTLAAFAATREGIVLHVLEDVRSVVRVRRGDGGLETVGALAGRSVTGISASASDGDVYVGHADYLDAPAIARLAVGARDTAVEVWDAQPVPFDRERYVVERHRYVSRDGTLVPLTTIARRDVPRDGTAPAVLYGYGGFAISLVPAFMPSLVPWLDAGGVYAIANLRGGGEFGEAWHEAGMRERKQNTFDDFAAAAQYLASSGIASRDRIAVLGGSNGGLLVATLATQHPELARAVVCLVPLTDMLRFDRFLIARLWVPEYGDPSDEADAAVLRAYSPYHNVRDGVAYPAMLVLTAEADSRVDPMHARKFAAKVQAATSSDAPVLCAIEADAGHGVGKPRRKVVAELVDRWAFLGERLGVAFGER